MFKPHRTFYTHWTCFDCRKCFKYLPLPAPALHNCPNCQQPMIDMGVYFEPPPCRDKKQWAVMELLAEHGFGFFTTGGKGTIRTFILMEKRPRYADVYRRIRGLQGSRWYQKVQATSRSQKEKKQNRLSERRWMKP